MLSLRHIRTSFTLLFTVCTLGMFYYFYSGVQNDYQKQLSVEIKGNLIELGYVITKLLEKEHAEEILNLLHHSVATHKTYDALSIDINGEVLSTSKNAISNGKRIVALDRLEHVLLEDEYLFTHTLRYYDKGSKKTFTLSLDLDTIYVNQFLKKQLFMIQLIFIAVILFMIGGFILLHFVVFRPLERFTFQVIHGPDNISDFPIREFAQLKKSFQLKYQEVIELNAELEHIVWQRTAKLEQLNKMLNDAQQMTHLGSWEWNIVENTLFWSDEIYRIFGLKPQEFAATYDAFLNTIHPEDRDQVKEAVARALETGDSYEIQHRIVLPDRTERIVYERGEIEFNEEEQPQRMIGSVQDITSETKQKEQIVKLSQVLEQVDDVVLITDTSGLVTYVNSAFSRHTGYHKEEILGKNAGLLKSGRHDKAFYKKMWDTIHSGKVYREQFINRKKNGDIYYEQKTITPIKNSEGKIISYVSTGKDITLSIEMTQRLEKMATTDQLTGIYNRHKFEELFAKELERTQRYGHPFILIMFDIDHFKNVNDTHGHDVGDTVLVETAKLIKAQLRSNDIFARWGGEEFLILSPETSIEHGAMLAEKLRSAIDSHRYDAGYITASFGVAEAAQETTKEELLRQVDGMLYQAKQNGRNTIAYPGPKA